MAIIKCPECGHQISDKAHVCPSCGVEIINNIVRCARCGDIYFKDQAECPHCHHRPMANAELSSTPAQQQNTPFTSTETTNVQTGEQTTTGTNIHLPHRQILSHQSIAIRRNLVFLLYRLLSHYLWALFGFIFTLMQVATESGRPTNTP